jgi:hypothetical protein
MIKLIFAIYPQGVALPKLRKRHSYPKLIDSVKYLSPGLFMEVFHE